MLEYYIEQDIVLDLDNYVPKVQVDVNNNDFLDALRDLCVVKGGDVEQVPAILLCVDKNHFLSIYLNLFSYRTRNLFLNASILFLHLQESLRSF